ncbi:unnamed protein product [Echinostoma caproni]|uniref:Syntaxin-16 n=1 Tax=Echinostoma caproni TaxID=27848 RepID=A0A183A533_9TREM|nr:unnamed protein product [Echinostoma caproni]
MEVSATSYKPFMSARFRVDPPDRHPSGPTSPPLNRLGVDAVDEQIQNIETLTAKVQSHRANLDSVIGQFQKSEPSGNRTLQDTLTDLKTMLESRKWRLERPKRYQMSLLLIDPDRTSPVAKQVLLFNEINILCAQTIKMATELKILIDQFLSDPNTSSPSYLSDPEGIGQLEPDETFYLMDAMRDLGREELNRRITEVRHRKMNENNARRIGQDTDRTLRETRKLFYDLIQGCEKCLL